MSIFSSEHSSNSANPRIIVTWSVISILLLILYGEVFKKWAVDIWTDPNYSHGVLIPLVSLYIIKQRLSQLRETESSFCHTGLFFILPALVLFILASVAGEQFSQRVSFVILIFGLVLFLEGKAIARLLLFPIALFIFAIPLPYILYNAIAFPLKLVATKIAAAAISLLGMPVFRDGNIIQLPHTTLEVVDACSGIRSLMTMITLAFLLANFVLQTFWKQVLLIILALPIAVLANAGRVVASGMLTKYDPAWGSGSLHEITGWVVFVISLGILVGISFLMARQKG